MGGKIVRVKAHSRRAPRKTKREVDNRSPIEKIVDAEVEGIIKGRPRKIS
jgi:hypothetical protein